MPFEPRSTNVLNHFGDANLAPSLEEILEAGDLSVMTRFLMWRDTVPLIMERPLLALSGGVLAYILQLQTAFTTIGIGVTCWAILGVSGAIMRIQDRDGKAENNQEEA